MAASLSLSLAASRPPSSSASPPNIHLQSCRRRLSPMSSSAPLSLSLAASRPPASSASPPNIHLQSCRRRLSPMSSSAPSSGIPRIYAVGRPLEDIYNVRVERRLTKERMDELNIDRWSVWKTGQCHLPWDWHVDQQVYIVSGEVRVVPEGAKSGERFMRFVAGDLVRYPKWFEADLFFNGPYEERYRFLAYGDE